MMGGNTLVPPQRRLGRWFAAGTFLWVGLVLGLGTLVAGLDTALLVLAGSGVILIALVSVDLATAVFVWFLFLAPFLVITPALDPTNRNYLAYAAILGLIAMARGLPYRAGAFADWGIGFLGWFCVSGLLTIASVGASSYTVVVVPLLSLSGYAVMRSAASRGREQVFLLPFIIFVMIESVLGIAQTFVGWPVFSLATPVLFTGPRNYLAYFIPSVSATVTQASGTYGHFNGLGGLLSLAVPLLFDRWRVARYSLSTGLPLAIAGIALVCTYSRGALLGAYLGILIVLVGAGAARGTRAVRLAFIGISTVAGLALSFAALSEYVSETGNLGIRESTWLVSLIYALGNPIRLFFGYGLGFFSRNVLGAAGTAARIHNGPLAVLLECGVVGFVLFVMAIRLGFVSLTRSRAALRLGYAGAIAGFLLHQLFDNSLFDVNGVLFWALVSIAVGGAAYMREGEPSDG